MTSAVSTATVTPLTVPLSGPQETGNPGLQNGVIRRTGVPGPDCSGPRPPWRHPKGGKIAVAVPGPAPSRRWSCFQFLSLRRNPTSAPFFRRKTGLWPSITYAFSSC